MSKLEIESWEERSHSENPDQWFGFVYFSDGSRVGYSPPHEHGEVWQPRTNGGGRYVEVTSRHLRMTDAFIKERKAAAKAAVAAAETAVAEPASGGES